MIDITKNINDNEYDTNIGDKLVKILDKLKIYENKILKTNDFNEPWIGNSQEHPPGDDNYYAQNDVYTYQVIYRKKARADDPQPDRIVTGHVTIIR